ncbi:MAG TPA: acyl-CoA dehydrogenase family protein [Burkholderiaceae bacterium]|nr:acyl-CoA dehydrogenase family protein [Burkholderiaceae bacterium]
MSAVAMHDSSPDPVAESFERALAELCTDPRIRAIEAGDDAAAAGLWREVDALGFTDALVPAELGGAGLTLQQACPLLAAAGRFGLNHPFGETMVARALLRAAGWQPDDGCIALARAAEHDHRSGEGAVVCREVPGARLAGHVLVQHRDAWLLMPCAKADIQPGTYRPHASATLSWQSPRDAVFCWDRAAAAAAAAGAVAAVAGAAARAGAGAGSGASAGADAVTGADVHAVADAETWNNAIHAAAMSGAMERVLALSVAYANDRRQFGRAIGQFQAVQQDLAVLAEQAGSAVLAARIGCGSPGREPGSQPRSLPDPQSGPQRSMQPDPLLAATAKLRASEAALRVAMLAHAVFGAIGITEEHVLGVFTTRLHEWRATAGTERDCAMRIGSALLRSGESFPAFIRAALVPAAHTESNQED